MKRTLSVMLTIIMLFTLLGCAQAQTGGSGVAVPYASELINVTSIISAALSNGKVEFTARITATTVVDKVGFSSIKIQEQSDSSWKTVKSVNGKYGYDRVSYAYALSYNGTVGKKYRAVVNYRVEDGDASDTRTRTSSGITAKN